MYLYSKFLLTVFMIATLSMRAMEQDNRPAKRQKYEEETIIDPTKNQPMTLFNACINYLGNQQGLSVLEALLLPDDTLPEHFSMPLLKALPKKLINENADMIAKAILTDLPDWKKIGFIKKLCKCKTIDQHRSSLEQLMNDPTTDKEIKKCIDEHDPLIRETKAFLIEKLFEHRLPTYQITGENQEPVQSIAWSPSGESLAISEGNNVKIWTIIDGQLSCVATLTGHTGKIVSVSWSCDGNYIATGSEDSTAKIWIFNKDTWICQTTLKEHTDKVSAVSWSPDNKCLATGSNDQTIKMWTINGMCTATLTGHIYGVTVLAWSPNGKKLATGSRDEKIKIWIFENNRWHCIATLTEYDYAITALSWSPDSTLLAMSTVHSTLKMWNIEKKQRKQNLSGQSSKLVSWSPCGTYLVTGSLKIWAVTNYWWENVGRLKDGNSDSITSLAWSPQGKNIVTGSRNGIVNIWDMNLLNKITQYQFSYPEIALLKKIKAQKYCGLYQFLENEQQLFNQLGSRDQELHDALHAVLAPLVK